MKKTKFAQMMLVLLLCVMTVCLAGCETARGIGRDIKDADNWIRDNLW